MSDIIVDLESDISTSQALVELLIEDDTSQHIYTALCQLVWLKVRDVTTSEEEQTLQVLTADRNDTSRMWQCSPRYAFEAVVALRWKHHQIETQHIFMYAKSADEIMPEVIQHIRALGWEPLQKTSQDYHV